MSEVHRREFLQKAAITGAAVGGAAWAAPSILGFEQAFAAGSVPPSTIVVGAVSTTVHGNNSVSPAIPAGSSTIYLLIFSINADNAGDTETPAFTGATWTLIASATTQGSAHQMLVYYTTNPTGTSVKMQTNNNDSWRVQMFGVSAGTTATAAAVANSTGGTAMSVASPAAATSSTNFVLIGTSLGATGSNWSVPAGFTSISDLPDNPDISLSQYNTTGTAPGTQTVSYGAGTFAHAVQVAIS
jgi:hypothetical protein